MRCANFCGTKVTQTHNTSCVNAAEIAVFESAHDHFHQPPMGSHQRRGRPPGKKKRPEHRERQELPSLSPVRPALAENLQETDLEDDYGEDGWDPHAGTKPSPLDGEASDECWGPEDDREDIEDGALNIRMVNMISKLQDDDLRDREWRPKQAQKKKQGQSSITH